MDVRLPDGTVLNNVPEGTTQTEIINRLKAGGYDVVKMGLEAPKGESGFLPAAKATIQSTLGGAALLGGKLGLLSPEEAQQKFEAREAEARRIFAPTENWSDGAFTKFKELLGGSVPLMVAPIAAAGAAAALPLTGPAAVAAGLGAAGLASATQFTMSNLSRQMETAKSLDEASLGAAAVAAAPQALLDVFAFRAYPLIKQLFTSVGKEITEEAAQNLAKQGITNTVKDYAVTTGKTAGVEGLTESGQSFLERLQAGLNIADPSARAEYLDSFIGGAVLGGTLAPVGRYIERQRQVEEPLAPGQRPGESLEQTAQRLNFDIKQMTAPAEKSPFLSSTELASMAAEENGYGKLVQYAERIKQEPDSPEKQASLEAAIELRKRVVSEAETRQTPTDKPYPFAEEPEKPIYLTGTGLIDLVNTKETPKDQLVSLLEYISKTKKDPESPERDQSVEQARTLYNLLQEEAKSRGFDLPEAFTLRATDLRAAGIPRTDPVYDQVKDKDLNNPDEADFVVKTLEAAQKRATPDLYDKLEGVLDSIDRYLESRPGSGFYAQRTYPQPSGEGVAVAGRRAGQQPPAEGLAPSERGGVAPVTEPAEQPVSTTKVKPAPLTEERKAEIKALQEERKAKQEFAEKIRAVGGQNLRARRDNPQLLASAKAGNVTGITNALSRSKNPIVAEVGRKGVPAGVSVEIDPEAGESYLGRDKFTDQWIINYAKNLIALRESLDNGAEFKPFKLRKVNNEFVEEQATEPQDISTWLQFNRESLYVPLDTSRAQQLKDIKQKVDDEFTRIGEDVVRNNASAVAVTPGVMGGSYDPQSKKIKLVDYFAKDEGVVAHEVVHAQVYEAVANPTKAQAPHVKRLQKLFEDVKKVAEEKDLEFYGVTGIQEFIAEGLGNPSFQFFLNTIPYEKQSAWSKFVQTIADLLGIKNSTALLEVLTVYDQLTPAKAVKKEKPAKKSLAKVAPQVSEAKFKELEAKAAKPSEAKPPEEKVRAPELQEKIDQLQGVLSKILAKYGLKDVKINLEEGMADEGSYSGQLIKLALDLDNPVRTLRHEAIHALKELGFFTPQQWKVLTDRAQKEWIEKYLKGQKAVVDGKEMTRYDAYMQLYDGDMEAIVEESIADAFADFSKTQPPAGMMRAILNRMQNLFKAIKQAMKVGGYDTAEDVFGAVEKGELPAPPSTSVAKGAKPSLRKWYDEGTPRQQDELDNLPKINDFNGMEFIPVKGLVDSANSNYEDFELAPGVREVPLAAEFVEANKRLYAQKSKQEYISFLAQKISANQKIEPLIVALEPDGETWVVEGQHRVRALSQLGYKSFPARVVVSMEGDRKDYELPLLKREEPKTDYKKVEGQLTLFSLRAPKKLVTQRIPELQEAASKVAAGEMTPQEYGELANSPKFLGTIAPFDFIPSPASDDDAETALDKAKIARWSRVAEIDKGFEVGLRLDIPAYQNHGVWINSIHQSGEPVKYAAVAAITNAEFPDAGNKALRVAQGEAKSPFAVIKGNWKPVSLPQAVAQMKRAFQDPAWTQVGYNPLRHSYFFDRSTGNPVSTADEVIQIGPLVLAKNAVIESPETTLPSGERKYKFSLRAPKTEQFKKWFDDSKIVDDKGEPLVVYHGTKRDFSAFRSKYPDALLFFTTNPKFASNWIVGFGPKGDLREPPPGTDDEYKNIKKIESSLYSQYMKPPEDYDFDTQAGTDQFDADRAALKQALKKATGFSSSAEFESNAGNRVMPLFLSIQNPFDATKDFKVIESFLIRQGMQELVDRGYHKTGNWLVYENKPVIDKLKQLGYDGIWISEDTNGPQETIAAFYPEQIKSAIGNVGAYGQRPITAEEAKNLGMTKAEAEEAQKAGDIRFSLRAPDTPQFKSFFGQSKIVNADGSPKLMYHGTARDITEFRPKQAGAIFVTDNPKFADMFASMSAEWMAKHADQFVTAEQYKEGKASAVKQIKKDYASDPKFRDLLLKSLDDEAGDYRQEALKILGKQFKDMMPSGPNIMPVYIRAENPFDYENKDHINALKEVEALLRYSDKSISDYIGGVQNGYWEDIESKRIQDVIKSLGFDGFYTKELDNKNLAVYSPNQIKSATGNEGTFDFRSPDIRKSLRPLPTLSSDVTDRIKATIVPRYRAGYVERILDAISPKQFSKFRKEFINRYDIQAKFDREAARQIKLMGGKEQLADAKAEPAALFADLGGGLAAAAMGVNDRKGGIPVYVKKYVVEKDFLELSTHNTKAAADAAAKKVPGAKVYEQGYTKVMDKAEGLLPIFQQLATYAKPKLGEPDAYSQYQFWADVKRTSKYILNPGTGKYEEKLFTQDDIKRANQIEKAFPEFVEIQKKWIAYNNGLVDFMRDTGVVSEAGAKEMKKHGDYFPLYRHLGEDDIQGPRLFTSIANVQGPKAAKGSESEVTDFFETIVRNTQSAIQAGIKNIAARRATDQAMRIGEVVKLNRPQSGPTVYRVLEDGKETYYQTRDPMFIESLKSLYQPDIPFIGLLSTPARILRNLVTKDPAFQLANMMRDSLSAYVASGFKFTPIVATLKQYAKAIADKSPEMRELRSAGVIGGYDYSQGVETSARKLEAEIRKAAKARTTMEKLTSPATSLWGALEKSSEASDSATRQEIYKKVLEQTGNEAEALYQALEIMNFNRKGRSPIIRILTAAVPFMNARIQGLDVLYRSGMRPISGDATEAEKKRMNTFWVRGMTLMALSGMYWLLTHDDEEYKAQEQETRDNYWLFPSAGVKIPIPFEIGVMFKVIPERILEYAFGSDTGKDFLKSMERQVVSTFAFNLIPQTFLPAYEVKTNYSFFTQRPVISPGMENISPEYQVGPNTSKVSGAIGQALNISPIKLDYLIQGYTGTMGMYAVNLFDAFFSMNDEAPKASRRLEQMPVLRRFMVDPEARGSISAYYDLKNSVDEVVRTSNFLQRSMDFENYGKYMQENVQMLAVKDYINDLEKTMKEYREMKNLVRISNMDADSKRDTLSNIGKLEQQLTKNIQTLKKQIASQ
jgi:hypothetical protein